MPAILMPILRLFGPTLLKAALQYLEGKYPGIKDVFKNIIDYLKAEVDKEQAVKTVQDVLYTSATLPQLKKS
jgi:hypothetical protein